ncbi:DUF3783 [Desulfonema limicola]|uniref:DUF3783 n=1 Tax=Desulfonema limicola TaxID=45656 RepID=A0A975B6U4_9BACT|nr:DUF3783 domain-containing protein [Desulfonema limicola]QTA79897.1 DUF3783 [Desulfonema limicola]
MSKAAFEKITNSDSPLYGPKKLLLCGFPQTAHSKFKKVMEYAGISDVPVVWVTDELSNSSISDILEMQDSTGQGMDSNLSRAVIVAGISQKQLHQLMEICRKTGMKKSLWAVVTPVSEKWSISNLLKELEEERRVLNKKR